MVRLLLVGLLAAASFLWCPPSSYGQCGRGGCGMGGCGMGGCGMGMGMPMMAPMMFPPSIAGMGGCGCGLAGCTVAGGACSCTACPVLPATRLNPGGAAIVAQVPDGSTVTIDGVPTTATGTERTYLTPSLEPGRDWHYRIVATVRRDGREDVVARTVTIRSGDRVQLDFSAPLTPEQRSASAR